MSENSPWKVGTKYFIRTATMHVTGELTAVGHQELSLKNAAWVADSRRFGKFLAEGPEPNAEIEPFPGDIIVGRGAIIDACEWLHELPRAVSPK